MGNSHEKGKKFELEVKRIMQDMIAKAKAEHRLRVASRPSLMGVSAEWQPDLVLMAGLLLDPSNPSLELAIVECKYVSERSKQERSKEGTYWTEMSRAYMSLNDLRLANREGTNFFLVVNRQGESKERDYSKIFRNIGVKLVRINIPEERVEFESDINRLLEETTYNEQAKKLKHVFEQHQ